MAQGLASLLNHDAPEAAALVARLLAVEAYHAGAVRATLLPLASRRLYPRDVTVAQVRCA